MKWQNEERGEGYYYITGTVTEWLPLLARADIRRAICYEIRVALARCKASLCAFVIMPDHLHMVVYLPNPGQLHAFLKCWRGRSARRMIDILLRQNDEAVLRVLARHANGDCSYAAWKEQARAWAPVTKRTLRQKIDYVHANPVRKGLVDVLQDWPHSSWVWYEMQQQTMLPVTPPEGLV